MALARGQVRWFFMLTLAITWGLQLPAVLAQRGILPGDPQSYLPLAGLGLLGPLVAAVVLSWREGGGAGVRALFAPLFQVQVGFRWYLLALAPPVLLTVMLAVLGWAGRVGPSAYVPTASAAVFGAFISVVEEVGWRGYAQPRLAARMGPLGAAMVVGVVWYLWHLPMFAGQGVPLETVLVMVLFFCGGALLFAGIQDGARGSLAPVVLAHWGAHLNNSHRALPADALPLVIHAIVYAALGLWLMRRYFSPAARAAARLL